MKIRYLYSHLNGLEFLLIHKPELWEEIKQTIESIDADLFKKFSKAKSSYGKEIYSQKDINKEFNTQFNQKGWKSHEIKYFFTPDEAVARETIGMTAVEQKSELLKVGRKAFSGKNQTDFLKDNIAIEVQFGKYAYVAYDLFVKHMAFYIANDINVGIEILPTKALQLKMDTGVPCYEKEVYNVYRSGRNTPAVPLIIIGIEPDTPDFEYESEDPNSYWEKSKGSH